jgi:hypothetical protein
MLRAITRLPPTSIDRPASVSQKNDELMRRKGASPTASGFCRIATMLVSGRDSRRVRRVSYSSPPTSTSCTREGMPLSPSSVASRLARSGAERVEACSFHAASPSGSRT